MQSVIGEHILLWQDHKSNPRRIEVSLILGILILTQKIQVHNTLVRRVQEGTGLGEQTLTNQKRIWKVSIENVQVAHTYKTFRWADQSLEKKNISYKMGDICMYAS